MPNFKLKELLKLRGNSKFKDAFMKRSNGLFNNLIFNYILFLIALLYSFVFIFFGIDFTDSFFYINMCKDYTSYPLITLTLLIGKGWMSLFGDSLISFRVLNWTISTFSILIPFFILIPSAQRRRNLKYISISIILLTIINCNVFGVDVCTLFFLSLSSSLIIMFIQTNKLIYLFLYSLSSTLLVLTRFPNILILPASVLALGIIEYNKNQQKLHIHICIISYIKKVIIYCVVSIIFYLIIVMLVYQSIPDFVSKLSFSIINIDESHSFLKMFKGYLRDLVKIFQYVGVCYLILSILNNRLNLKLLIQRGLLFFTIILFILFLKFEIGVEMYNWKLSLFYSALVYSILIFYCISSIKKKEYHGLITISVIFIFSIIPALGSNTGLLKISSYLLVFLPVMIISNRNVLTKSFHPNLLFAIFMVFVLFTRMMIVYEDSKITDLKKELRTEKINYIKTTSLNVEFIESVLKEFRALKKDNKNVLFYGRASHVLYYLTDTKPLNQFSFWMSSDNLKDVKKAEQIIISQKPIVIFMPSYPENSAQYFTDRKTFTPFEAMLIENGYNASAKNSFIIYNP